MSSKENQASPAPRALVDISSVVREMGAVYRDMRKGAIDMSDGTKLAYVLKELRAAIEASSVTDRLAAIEDLLRNGGSK